jgi:LIVCS family branched-chain amino acid:cation transporter
VIVLVLADPEILPGNLPGAPGATQGILEGYQTFDAMGAVVVGAVIIISLNFRKELSYRAKKAVISRAGILAGLGLCIIYAGLIYSGAKLSNAFLPGMDRTEVLNGMIRFSLGEKGHIILALLISLACFSTTVGIITGASDYVKGFFPSHPMIYKIAAATGCIIGILIGQWEVGFIIDAGIPILLFIYPLIITFIILHNLPEKWVGLYTFRAVTYTVIIFCIPDVLNALDYPEPSNAIRSITPWNTTDFTWVAPAAIAFLLMQIKKNQPES